MRDAYGQKRSVKSRETCLQIVRALINLYDWSLLSENELVDRVWASIDSDISGREIKGLCLHHYALATYSACQPGGDPARRERAYTELGRYLLRTACKMGWADCAESIAQDALVLVYEHIGECRSPGAFLIFGKFKLLQAYKSEMRQRAKEPESMDALEDRQEITQDGATPQADLEWREKCQVLLDAIRRISNERQREALFLIYYCGWTRKRVAAHLGITPGYVRVLAKRGRDRLRQDRLLQAYLPELLTRQSEATDEQARG